MGRIEQFWGANDVDKMFGGSPMTVTPWGRAGGLKNRADYDPERVRALLLKPHEHELVDIDPRHLKATQPMLTRAGVKHYMDLGNAYYLRGEPMADKHNPGNQRPIMYHREDDEQLLLSGHHRAAAALLQGRQFKGYRLEGPWGPPR